MGAGLLFIVAQTDILFNDISLSRYDIRRAVGCTCFASMIEYLFPLLNYLKNSGYFNDASPAAI